MKSIFTNKAALPSNEELKNALGLQYKHWQVLADYCIELYPDAKSAWHYSGDKYGWSYRISDNKRVILYLLPRDNFFKVAFVFGQKATDEILKSKIAENVKKEILAAKVYAEGRGIRLDIKNSAMIEDIKNLIYHKINY
jgi:hypothetical protein